MSDVTFSERLVSEHFARFIQETSYEQLSPEVVEKVKECVLDHIGVQLLASTLTWSRMIYDYAAEFSCPGKSTIVGVGKRFSPLEAAFVNASFGQGCELDDAGHAGAATIPIALALAEHLGANGRDLITSIAVGYEIFFRVFDAVMPQILKRGFHQQCVVGVFPAAAVAGKLLGLSEEKLVHALGIAGSHASATAEYDQSGGEVKRIHAGLAARGGIQAALLADRGLTGPRAIFEGKRGIFRTFVDHYEAEGITLGLGKELQFPRKMSFKAYPTVGSIHTSIDAFADIISEHNIQAKDVKDVNEIRVGVAEHVLAHGAGIIEPEDVIGAQFSLAYSLALRLVYGRNDLDLYLDPKLWHDPTILSIARKVKAYADPTATGKMGTGRVAVVLADGHTFEACSLYRKGSSQNPFTKEELMAKFRRLATSVLDANRADKVAQMVNDLDKLRNLREFTALLAPG